MKNEYNLERKCYSRTLSDANAVVFESKTRPNAELKEKLLLSRALVARLLAAVNDGEPMMRPSYAYQTAAPLALIIMMATALILKGVGIVDRIVALFPSEIAGVAFIVISICAIAALLVWLLGKLTIAQDMESDRRLFSELLRQIDDELTRYR